MLIVIGVVLAVPATFMGYFVYENLLATAIFAGLGTPILLYGVSKWIAEGMAYKNLIEGAATTGLPLFIVSEVMIFMSLFAAYWMMRLFADVWPPVGTPEMPVVMPLIMTGLLLSSSYTIHLAEEQLKHHNSISGFRTWVIATIVLGSAFLGCTIFEYSHLIAHGFNPTTNAFSTAFFSITGFHASHVLVGILAFFALLIPALVGKANKTFAICVSVYWHFVDIIWFFVVSQIYFW